MTYQIENPPPPLPFDFVVVELIGAESLEFEGVRYFFGLKSLVDRATAEALGSLPSEDGTPLFKVED